MNNITKENLPLKMCTYERFLHIHIRLMKFSSYKKFINLTFNCIDLANFQMLFLIFLDADSSKFNLSVASFSVDDKKKACKSSKKC